MTTGYTKMVSVDELGDLLTRVGKKAPAVVRTALHASRMAMVRDVVRNRMSGQYLGVRTGTARRSISGDLGRSENRVSASIGSPLDYVRAHEVGFHGRVQVPAHTRMLVPLVRTARGRLTKRSAKRYTDSVRAGRKRVAHVRAHTRMLNLRARHFLRDTVLQEAGDLPGLLQSGSAPFARRIVAGLRVVVEQNRMPRVSELGVGR